MVLPSSSFRPSAHAVQLPPIRELFSNLSRSQSVQHNHLRLPQIELLSREEDSANVAAFLDLLKRSLLGYDVSQFEKVIELHRDIVADLKLAEVASFPRDPYDFKLSECLAKESLQMLTGHFQNILKTFYNQQAEKALQIAIVYDSVRFVKGFTSGESLNSRDALQILLDYITSNGVLPNPILLTQAITCLATVDQTQSKRGQGVELDLPRHIFVAFLRAKLKELAGRVSSLQKILLSPRMESFKESFFVPLYILSFQTSYFPSALRAAVEDNLTVLALHFDHHSCWTITNYNAEDTSKFIDQIKERCRLDRNLPLETGLLTGINEENPQRYFLNLDCQSQVIVPIFRHFGTPPPEVGVAIPYHLLPRVIQARTQPAIMPPPPPIKPCKELLQEGGDDALALKRLYAKFCANFHSDWFQEKNSLDLVSALSDSRCAWRFDFSTEKMASLFNQLMQFAILPANSHIRAAILLDVYAFFYGQNVGQNVGSVQHIEASRRAAGRIAPLLANLGKISQPSTPEEIVTRYGRLSEADAKKVAPAFLLAKMAELLLRGQFPEQTISREKEPPKTIPFFLLSEDAEVMQLELFNLYHDGEFFIQVLSDKTNSAEEHLLSLLDGVTIQTEAEHKKCLLSPHAYRQLFQKARTLNTLEFLILRKQNHPFVTVSPDDDDETISERSSANLGPKRVAQHSTPKLTDARKVQNHKRSAASLEPRNTSTQRSQRTEAPATLTNPNEAWMFWMRCDVTHLEKKVWASIRAKKLYMNASQLAFKEAKKLSSIALEAAPLAVYNPLFKSYQRTALGFANHMRENGFGTVLALDMGLGKSKLGHGAIVEMIATYKSGHHLVFVPFSVLDTIHEEYQESFVEAKLTSLKIWCRRHPHAPSSRNRLQRYVEELQREFLQNKKLASYLKIFADLPQELIKQKLQLNRESALRTLHTLVSEHFSKICTFLKSIPEQKVEIESQCQRCVTELDSIELSKELKALARSFLRSYPEESDLSLLQEVFSPRRAAATSTFLQIASLLLRINLHRFDDKPESFAATDAGLEAIMNFPLDCIVATKSDEEFTRTLQRHSSSIIIATPETLKNVNYDVFTGKRLLTFLIDEAHKIKKSKKAKNKRLHLLAQRVKTEGEKQPDKIKPFAACLTGTPLPNSPMDLWSILRLANPDLFSLDDYLGLETHLKAVVELLFTKDHPFLQEAIQSAFTAFYCLKITVFDRLVFHLKKESPQARQAWNNHFPEREDVEVDVSANLTPATRTALKVAFNDFLDEVKDSAEDQANYFAYQYRITRILLHESLSGKDESINSNYANPKIHAIRERIFTQLSQVVEESDLLRAILQNPRFLHTVEAKTHCLIIIDTTVVSHVIRDALAAKYSPTLDVAIFDGKLSRAERQKRVEWFETVDANQAKVLLLALEAGGVGINLNSAVEIIDLTKSKVWVPAEREQAISRAFRPNHLGKKRVTNIQFGTFYEKWQQVVHAEKNGWNRFFWPSDSGARLPLKDHFDNFLTLLRAICFHKHFWGNKKIFATLECGTAVPEDYVDAMTLVVEPNLIALKASFNGERIEERLQEITGQA